MQITLLLNALVAVSKGMQAVKLRQQNPPVLNCRCRLTHVDLSRKRWLLLFEYTRLLTVSSTPGVRDRFRFLPRGAMCIFTAFGADDELDKSGLNFGRLWIADTAAHGGMCCAQWRLVMPPRGWRHYVFGLSLRACVRPSGGIIDRLAQWRN